MKISKKSPVHFAAIFICMLLFCDNLLSKSPAVPISGWKPPLLLPLTGLCTYLSCSCLFAQLMVPLSCRLFFFYAVRTCGTVSACCLFKCPPSEKWVLILSAQKRGVWGLGLQRSPRLCCLCPHGSSAHWSLSLHPF